MMDRHKCHYRQRPGLRKPFESGFCSVSALLLLGGRLSGDDARDQLPNLFGLP